MSSVNAVAQPDCGDVSVSRTETPLPCDLATNAAFAGWISARLVALVDELIPGREVWAESLSFDHRADPAEPVTIALTVLEHHDRNATTLSGAAVGARSGRRLAVGTIRIGSPDRLGGTTSGAQVPADISHRRWGYEELLARCQNRDPLDTAVIWPIDHVALAATVEAAQAGLIVPTLIGPGDRIRDAAAAAGLDVSRWVIAEAGSEAAAAAAGVRLVRAGEAHLLMKGSLHTAELMHAVLNHEHGLPHATWLSHVFVFDVPAYPKPLLLTDAAVTIAPTLEQKAVICRNAIGVAHALGIARPKVAILSAIEDVDPAIPSTLDAAALCKMADRGQIAGAVVDGPLAMDNAVSMDSTTTKRIVSPVAGDADILLVPNLEAGNILYKNLVYLADAEAAGVIVGACVPIVLTSRSDSVRTRLASTALASVLATS